MEQNERNFFIDIIKGIAIFLMLWGHCIQYCVANSDIDFFENVVFKTIYSFHMPLFMLVSGYLFFYSFSKRNLKELLIHKTQTLLQPIILCSAFNYFVTTVLFSVISGDFSPAFNGSWLNNLSSLWFLWSVLAASLITSIICKKCSNIFVQIILFLIAIPVIAMFPNRDMNLYMYPYFVLGFYFAKYKDRIPKILNNLKYISLFLFPILIFYYVKNDYIHTTGLLGNDNYSLTQILSISAYRWFIGIVGSVFVIVVSQLIYTNLVLKSTKPILSTMLSKVGKNSLQMYTFSVPFLSTYLSVFFPKVLSILNIENIFAKNIFVYNFIFTFSLAIIYAFALYYIIKFFDKIKITKILYG